MLCGLIAKREAWCLTRRGWLFAVALSSAVVVSALLCCEPFLRQNRPIPAEALIVEGWLPDYALEGASLEFARRGYKYIITTGGPLPRGYLVSNRENYADLAATDLIRLGVASNLVFRAPAPGVYRGRTLAHARAAQRLVQGEHPDLKSVNVYSLGVHSRRTRLTFLRVFGDAIEVGIIAHPDKSYDAGRWWATSEGFRTVSREVLAYLWMRLAGGL